MFPEFDSFSVLSKGYACGLGGDGYQSFALLSKGYLCEPVEDLLTGKGRTRKQTPITRGSHAQAMREDEEIVALVESYFTVRRKL